MKMKFIFVLLAVVAGGFIFCILMTVLTRASARRKVDERPGMKQDIAALIEGLRDSNYEHRDMWNRHLILFTGLSFDFKPNGSLEERDAAIQRWRQWWQKNKDRRKEEWLIDAVRDGNYKYRLAALKELRKLRTPLAAPVFVQLLKEKSVDLRKESTEALGELSLKETVPALLDALADSEPEVRRRAAKALGAIGDPAAVPNLLSRSEDPDFLVRVEVAQALVKLSRKDALPVLLSLLREGDVYAASFAADSISLCADENSVPLIAPLLPVAKPPVRAKLVRALQKITGQSFGEDPKEWLKWHESGKSQQH
jgi:hypothetical protein